MTVVLIFSPVIITGNNSATQFDFNWDYTEGRTDEIVVLLRDETNTERLLVENIDYSISGQTVTYPLIGSPLSEAERIVITRKTAETQEVSLINNGEFFLSAIEDMIDKNTRLLQEIDDKTSRSFLAQAGENVGLIFPGAENETLKYDSEGNLVPGPTANAIENASADALSAAAAAASATEDRLAVEAVLNSFDDRYLGAQATEPVEDNNGDPLVVGSIYYNTSTNTMRIYNGTDWQDLAAGIDLALRKASNLSDLNNVEQALDNLGLSTFFQTLLAAENISALKTLLNIGTVSGLAVSSAADLSQSPNAIAPRGVVNAAINSSRLVWRDAIVSDGSSVSLVESGIPAGVSRIIVAVADVSFGTPSIRLGTSAGLLSSGYKSLTGTLDGPSVAYAVRSRTSEFLNAYGGSSLNGNFEFSLVNPDTNTWSGSGVYTRSTSGIDIAHFAGSITLPDVLTSLEIFGSTSFNAGQIRVGYM
jgi:hypothetical protein